MPGDTQVERRPYKTETETPAGLPSLRAPEHPEPGPSYYDVSFLKAPVWKWEICWYFFLGGLSAGAFILARLAERFGGRSYRNVTRVGTAVAAVAAVPCAPLLILDLGDPARFHHMLRVWKPRSPMNLGAWTLSAYSGTVAMAVLREWLLGDRNPEERSLAEKVRDGVLLTVTDVAGIPLALLLAGYTGVLLSTNATPVWNQDRWIGAEFSSGAMASGAAATSLALEAFHSWKGTVTPEGPSESLEKISLITHLLEGATMAGLILSTGRLSKPLTAGPMSGWFWGAATSLLGSVVTGALAPSGPKGRWARAASAMLGLAGSFAVRWAVVHAGRHSADNPDAAREAHSTGRPGSA